MRPTGEFERRGTKRETVTTVIKENFLSHPCQYTHIVNCALRRQVKRDHFPDPTAGVTSPFHPLHCLQEHVEVALLRRVIKHEGAA